MLPYLFCLSSVATVFAEEAEPAVAMSPAPAGVESAGVARMDLSQAIQPRNAAATWVYSSVYYLDGTQHSNGATLEEVIEVKEVEGVTCYLVKLTMDWRSIMDRLSGVQLSTEDYDYCWEYFDENGSYNYSPEPEAPHQLHDLSGFELTLPYPVETGHSYIAEEVDYTVVDTEAAVKVPAGEFKCTVYQMLFEDTDSPEDSTRERYYMAPGVGLVRWEMDNKQSGSWQLDSRDDLVKFDLKLEPEAEAVSEPDGA